MSNNSREQYLSIIEKEKLINGRYYNIKRMGPNGGNGAFSIMVTAKDKVTKNTVALKFYDPTKFGDTDRFKRFEREAEVLALLKDEPMAVNCIDDELQYLEKNLVDANTGLQFPPLKLPYISVEKAEYSVEDLIYSIDPSPLDMLRFFRELSKAVFRIHRKYICHRDLKPSNFLVYADKLCLSDFGTAKYMNGSMPDIRSNYIDPVGDMRYVSPESITSIAIADEHVYKADIFSLGATLFEMFTKSLYCHQIYTRNVVEALLKLRTIPPSPKKYNGEKALVESIRLISKSIKVPNIYSFNDYVPPSIKDHLNALYKQLVSFDYTRRLTDATSIFRKIDICIKILVNEHTYLKWHNEKRRRHQIRIERKIGNKSNDYQHE